jgi:hypothetical protein
MARKVRNFDISKSKLVGFELIPWFDNNGKSAHPDYSTATQKLRIRFIPPMLASRRFKVVPMADRDFTSIPIRGK